jgi:hypothetical protein
MASKKEQMMMMLQQQMMQQQMVKQQMMEDMIEMNQANQVVGAIDNILEENINLKKELTLNNVQKKKNKMIDGARLKQVNINKRRTGK